MTPMQDTSAILRLAELLRQASEAGQNASRALAQMRRAHLPAGSFQETDPETLRQGQNRSATSSHNNATSHPSSGEGSAGD